MKYLPPSHVDIQLGMHNNEFAAIFHVRTAALRSPWYIVVACAFWDQLCRCLKNLSSSLSALYKVDHHESVSNKFSYIVCG